MVQRVESEPGGSQWVRGGPGWPPGLGTDLGGNLDIAPWFLDPIDPAWAPTTFGNLRLHWMSPAIDAGDNSLLPPGVITDLDGRPRIVNRIVDMGAYEYSDASLLHFFYLAVLSNKAQP